MQKKNNELNELNELREDELVSVRLTLLFFLFVFLDEKMYAASLFSLKTAPGQDAICGSWATSRGYGRWFALSALLSLLDVQGMAKGPNTVRRINLIVETMPQHFTARIRKIYGFFLNIKLERIYNCIKQ